MDNSKTQEDIILSYDEVEHVLSMKIGDVVRVAEDGRVFIPPMGNIYLWDDRTFHSTPEWEPVSEDQLLIEETGPVQESEVDLDKGWE